MKSIRLSLIAYFLLLLAVALGSVSLLFYRSTSRALQEKQATNRELLGAQYEERRKEELAKTDGDLLQHARILATSAQTQVEYNRLYVRQYFPLGLLAAATSPNGHLFAPLWAAEGYDARLRFQLGGMLATQIQLNEDLLQRTEGSASDLFQINITRGGEWRSRSLGERLLPRDTERFQQMRMLDWEFDEFELAGVKYRRVLLKAPIMRTRFVPPSFAFPPPDPGTARREPGSRASVRNQDTPPFYNTPPFYIQCAHDTSARDAEIAQLEASMGDQLRESDDEAQRVLRQLQARMLWIGLATFAAFCVGGSILVGVGLSPLRRLSEAVSRVSDKDFRLRFEGPEPPSELLPIVGGLQQTLNMLQHAFDREKQAAADISHELRTPLAGLLTAVEVSLRKPRTPDEYRETLTECRGIIQQMSLLVSRLLMLTRLDARSDVVRFESVDVGEIADQCAAVIRPLARINGLELKIHKSSAVPFKTDPDKLREVISNLLHNAVEYNRPEGRIDLTVKTTGDGLHLEVHDTGIGIAPEFRERIFERFFRADESRHDAGAHAGLGLAIVRGYVGLLGGKITVNSEPGRGSTFHVHIPAPQG